jgi:hypothetical protein
MTAVPSKRQLTLARVAALALVTLILLGLILNGASQEVFSRGLHNILQRSGGPMSFRFILQPTMAALAALHDGIRDARTQQPPYIWTILTHSASRRPRLREGLIATARIMLLGLVMDAIYQITVLHAFYPGEMAAIAVLLAFVPYFLLRGPMGRLAHWWSEHKIRIEKH